MLAGAHQGGRTLLVLHVDVGSTGEQGLHHLLPAVADGQHQRRLASLRGKRCCQAAPAGGPGRAAHPPCPLAQGGATPAPRAPPWLEMSVRET